MATYEFLSEAEYDEVHNLYLLKATVDLGDDDIRVYEQEVIFKKTTAETDAQAYVDELESELKKQKEAERPEEPSEDEEPEV